VVPAQFRVLVVRRPKYACRSCHEVVVQAPTPPRLIEGGLPTEALVAHVVFSKYADHCPLYRQAQIYSRQGIELDRSTLADWTGRAAFLLRPLHSRLLEKPKASPKLFADETTAPVLDPGRGRTKTGQLWTYARDDHPGAGCDPPGVAYVYAPDRTGERPLEHLNGFRGVLQVDGYGGYRKLARKNTVSLAFCWSQAAGFRSSSGRVLVCSTSPVAISTMSLASWLGSRGRLGCLFVIGLLRPPWKWKLFASQDFPNLFVGDTAAAKLGQTSVAECLQPCVQFFQG
jgi:hypothetical protein